LATPRRRAARALQIVAIAAVLWFAWSAAREDWNDVRETALRFNPEWPLIVLAGLVVLAAYALTIEAWRRLMRDWGTKISYMPSARIWFVSVLGRYIPGRIWSVAAVGVMAKKARISPLTAISSAVLMTIINTVVGFSLVLGFGGPQLVRRALGWEGSVITEGLTVVITLLPLAVVLALPLLIRPLTKLVAGLLRKPEIHTPHVQPLSVLRSALACCAAWIMYGGAFWLFLLGLFSHDIQGSVRDYLEAYTASYLLGYVAVFTPSGLGAREWALESLLKASPILMSTSAAFLAAWYSRVWISILEIAPGIAFLLFRAADPETSEAAEQESATDMAVDRGHSASVRP
jgi:hypothetical protein